MRNDKSDCNLQPFHATLWKIENKNQHDSTSLSLEFELPAVKSGGTDNDTSPVKGALTHPEGCYDGQNTTSYLPNRPFCENIVEESNVTSPEYTRTQTELKTRHLAVRMRN